MGLSIHRPSLLGFVLLILQAILLVLAVINFIFSPLWGILLAVCTILLVVVGIAGVFCRHRLMLLAFGVFALILLVFSVVSFILCLVDDCSIAASAAGGVYVAFYAATVVLTIFVYMEASKAHDYATV